jgi:ubiquinone/menaquinone biosynthesis C-methylase UbiE
MAVVFMKKLEQEPATYEQGFTSLTGGINVKVQDWIVDCLVPTSNVLEIGPGPGTLSIKMAGAGHAVTAIEKNKAMLKQARKNREAMSDAMQLNFQWGEVMTMDVKNNLHDAVVSTFMMSELRSFEQQVFLRKAWRALKTGGKLLIADEFVPRGVWKVGFNARRWLYKRKTRRLASGLTHPLTWFVKYPVPIGFKLVSHLSWQHGAIQAFEYEKIAVEGQEDPGFYRPPPRQFKGIRAMARVARCLLGGQVDHVSIEPGIYASGQAGPGSPILVTANYEYTYIKLMNDLARRNIDAWVLCVDSRGINVWCAARGGDFGNKQLVEAVQATGIENVTSNKVLVLPQLSAGGVEAPKLPRNSTSFPFTVKFGPVWSKDLPDYLASKPARKPESMKLARFTLQHRLVAGLTHFAFSARKIFLLPTVLLIAAGLGLLSFWGGSVDILRFTLELWVSLLITNFILLGIAYPITRFTRNFIGKGLVMGVLNALLVGIVMMLAFSPAFILSWNTAFDFWVGFFSTMSFSGYTMDTSPREIDSQYVRFQVLNIAFLVLGAGLSVIGPILT